MAAADLGIPEEVLKIPELQGIRNHLLEETLGKDPLRQQVEESRYGLGHQNLQAERCHAESGKLSRDVK